MLLHPEAQRKAQKEIDDVLKQERLPEFSDRESIPYVEYAMQESLRYVLSSSRLYTPINFEHQMAPHFDIWCDPKPPVG